MIATRQSGVRIPIALRGTAAGTALCGLTIFATTWTLLATGWVDGASGAFVVGMAAVLEAAVLAYARVSRVLAAVLIPVLALAAIIPATISALPFDGDASPWHLITRYLGASLGGLATTQDWSFSVGLCAVIWICGYWMTWLALREHRGVFAVVPVYIVLATNVLNARSDHDPALPTVLTVGFSFLVIANAYLDALLVRWQKRNIRALPGIRAGMVGSTAVIGVGIIILGSVLPRATSTDISGQFFTGGGSNGHGSRGAGGAEGNGPATIGFNVNTQPGGPLISNPKPVLTYTADTNAPVFLRVINDTTFNAGNWYPEHAVTTYDRGIVFTSLPFRAGSLPIDSARSDGALASDTVRITALIKLRPHATDDQGRALFPGDAQSVNANGIVMGTVDENNGGDRLLTADSVQIGSNGGATITTTGLVSTATAAQLRIAGTDYPAYTQRYTVLGDDSHSARTIAALARDWTKGTTNPYDSASAIEQHLRDPSQFTYTLSPPTPPPAQWPIVYFLTTSHRGYCQYFASAMGTMLRSLGIPARLVNGYGPGATLATGNRHGQREQQVTTSDAHTWVEAYFPGYGWVPFEPTPPSSVGDYVPFGRGAAATQGATSPSAGAQKPGFSEPLPLPPGDTHTSAPAKPRSAATPDFRLVSVSAAGFIGVSLLGAALWLLLPQSKKGAWRRLEFLGRILGVRRKAHETHRMYAARFSALLSGPRAPDSESGPRQGRRSPAEIVALLARGCAADAFSKPGARAQESGVRAMWLTVLLAAPGLVWRVSARRATTR